MGLLGCGGRGTTHAETILHDTDARLIAVADMFQDRLDKAKEQIDKLSAAKGHGGVEQTFVGPKAYQQIVESKLVDAVVIATPPYFHVEHLAAAVAAGKHVYCEKPVAIDVPGTKRVLEIGKKAEGKLSLDVGFQIRMAPPYIELVRRIHAGALGDIVSGSINYNCPAIDANVLANAKDGWVALHLFPNPLANSFEIGQLRHDGKVYYVQGAADVRGMSGSSNRHSGSRRCAFAHSNLYSLPEDLRVATSD